MRTLCYGQGLGAGMQFAGGAGGDLGLWTCTNQQCGATKCWPTRSHGLRCGARKALAVRHSPLRPQAAKGADTPGSTHSRGRQRPSHDVTKGCCCSRGRFRDQACRRRPTCPSRVPASTLRMPHTSRRQERSSFVVEEMVARQILHQHCVRVHVCMQCALQRPKNDSLEILKCLFKDFSVSRKPSIGNMSL